MLMSWVHQNAKLPFSMTMGRQVKDRMVACSLIVLLVIRIRYDTQPT